MTRKTKHRIDETGKCLLGLGLGYWLLNWMVQLGWLNNATLVAMVLCGLGAAFRSFAWSRTEKKDFF
jgi:hypothetical protein